MHDGLPDGRGAGPAGAGLRGAGPPSATDPFGTGELRRRVLGAWAASPARFREDANAEEDYALGGYRDRVIVELAQNAADAAARDGIPGRLLLTLTPRAGLPGERALPGESLPGTQTPGREPEYGALTAANTGAPLDAAGVAALATLRASGKTREPGAEATGRFGVGFAAAVAVSDSPCVVSSTGSVRFSRDAARDLVAGIPALAGELAARAGHVPVLRLPFPAAGTPSEGYDTAVTLPLRNAAARSLAERLLAEAGPALLLALPALAEIRIETGGMNRVLAAGRDGDSVTITVTASPQVTGPVSAMGAADDADISPGIAGTVAGTGNGSPPIAGAAGTAGSMWPLSGAHASGRAAGAVSRWRTATATGSLDPALLADRPVEERARPSWSVRWAVPVATSPAPRAVPARPDAPDVPAGRLPEGMAAVVHAPTPSDEPLGLPALLIASFPLGPDRRHVAPGPLTGFLVERAAEAYARLLPGLAPGPGLLDLVPGLVAHGELDGQLRRAILARLPDVAFLPSAIQPAAPAPPDAARSPGEAHAGPAGGGGRIRPRDALLLDAAPPGLAGFLAPVLPGLIAGPARHPAYPALGVRRVPMAELADMLAALDRPPSWWRRLYDALAAADPAAIAELGSLPVPLADGRLVRGPRGLLLPGPGLEHPGRLAPLGVRVVHPDAAHPLLTRLGAAEATPRAVLTHPAVRAAVEASLDEEDPGPVADAVLGLVAAAGARPGEYPWLADLALPGSALPGPAGTGTGGAGTAEEGARAADTGPGWYPANELLLPGGELAGVMAADAPFGIVSQELTGRYGAATLEAAGVLSSFSVLSAEDVDLGDDPGLDADGMPEWAADVRERAGDADVPPVALHVAAVRDLELVDPARWPRALELIAGSPAARAALTEPVRVRLADGRHADMPSYTAWWLRRHPVLGGHRPRDLRAAGSDPLLAGLYDDAGSLAGPGLAALLGDPAVARALGVRSSLASLLAEPGGPDELLGRLADPARPVTRQQLRALWTAFATAAQHAVDQPAGTGAGACPGGQPAARLAPSGKLALGSEPAPPGRVRAVRGEEVVVASAGDVMVLDSPDLWPLAAGLPLVLAPYDLALVLADLLDLPLVCEEVPGRVETHGQRRAVPAAVAAVVPDAPDSYLAHDTLVVDGVPVPWRCADGEVHAAGPAGLARGLAWAAGDWPARHLLAALLADPAEAPRLLAEADLDPRSAD